MEFLSLLLLASVSGSKITPPLFKEKHPLIFRLSRPFTLSPRMLLHVGKKKAKTPEQFLHSGLGVPIYFID